MKYGGIWAQCLCTFIFLASVLLLGFGPREITRELTILEGQPPPFESNQLLLGITLQSFSFLSQNWETQKCIVWGC